MSEPALRLLEDDGTPEEIARLREVIADLQQRLRGRAEAIEAIAEDLRIERETVKKYSRENATLKAQLVRQQRDDSNDPLVRAVFDFWKALRGSSRLSLGPKRTKVIMARLRDDPPAQPKDFIWPILGLVLDPTPKRDGTGFHDDVELALRDDSKMYDYAKRGRAQVERSGQSPRYIVHDLGGDEAIQALERLLELQKERYPDE